MNERSTKNSLGDYTNKYAYNNKKSDKHMKTQEPDEEKLSSADD